MKFKSKGSERLYTVTFMAIVTIIFITLTSGIYLFTRDKIIANKTLFIKRAVLNACDIKVPGNTSEIVKLYATRIREVVDNSGKLRYMEILDSQGKLTGYAIMITGPGLWGEIEAVIGFTKNLERLTGIDFIKQNETPGLGARISEAWFKEQFRDKKGPFKLVPEGTAKGEGEIDAITGASITSNAVLDMVNNAVKQIGLIVKK